MSPTKPKRSSLRLCDYRLGLERFGLSVRLNAKRASFESILCRFLEVWQEKILLRRKNMDFKLPADSMEYSMPWVNATRHPVSSLRVSPCRSFLITVPPAWIKAMPSPTSFCKMKPSPPKNPVPSCRWNAIWILVPKAAARNASFWQIISFPNSFIFSGMMEPGYGAEKATHFFQFLDW